LIAGYVPLVIHRPGDTGPISQALEDGETFRIERPRASIVTLQFDDIGQVTERTGDGLVLAQFSPQHQALFEQRTRF